MTKQKIETMAVAAAIIAIAVATEGFGLSKAGGLIMTLALIGGFIGARRKRGTCGC